MISNVPSPVSIEPGPSPGWLTSEFWTHALVVLGGVLTSLLALLHPGFKVPDYVPGLVPSVSLLMALAAQGWYLVSRHGLKKAHLVAFVAANAAAAEVAAKQIEAAIAGDKAKPVAPAVRAQRPLRAKLE
jgi:hypothetical protein